MHIRISTLSTIDRTTLYSIMELLKVDTYYFYTSLKKYLQQSIVLKVWFYC